MVYVTLAVRSSLDRRRENSGFVLLHILYGQVQHQIHSFSKSRPSHLLDGHHPPIAIFYSCLNSFPCFVHPSIGFSAFFGISQIPAIFTAPGIDVYKRQAFDRSRKFHNFIGSSFALRRLSDRVCIEHELSVIDVYKRQARGNCLRALLHRLPQSL